MNKNTGQFSHIKNTEKVKKNYFYKMLYLCLMVISTTTFVLTLFFYQKYTDALTENLINMQEKSLEKSAQIMKDTSNEINLLYNTLLIDSKVSDFNQASGFDAALNYSAYQSVKKFYNTNQYLEALYIYNCVADDTVTCGSYQFDSASAFKILEEQDKAVIFPSKLRDSDKSVLTFGYPVYIDNFQELSGGIFISLDTSKLSAYVLKSGFSSAVIVDSSKQILLSDISSEEDALFYTTELLNWTSNTNHNTLSELKTFKKVSYLCSYYKDSNSGLTFICSTPYSSMIEPMAQQRNLYLLVAIVIFIFAVFFQYIVTRQLYQPLNELTNRLKHSKYSSDIATDEFTLIDHVYRNALMEINALEKEISTYLPHLKQELLSNLLLYPKQLQETQTQLERNGWKLPFKGMFLCCFHIEHDTEQNSSVSVLSKQLQKYIYKHMQSDLYVECVNVDSNQLVCLINTVDNTTLTFDELLQSLETIKNELIHSYQVTLTVSLNGLINDITDVPVIYQQTLELRNYRFVFGDNQLIYPKRIMDLMPECIVYPAQLDTAIMNSLISCNKHEFSEQVIQFTDILKQYTYETASVLYNQLYMKLLLQLQKLYTSDKKADFYIELLSMPQTLDEGIQFLFKLFDVYASKKNTAEQFKNNKHYSTILESKDYIEKNYSDCNLNANMIAEHVNLSTNYFTKLFKTITGFYINDYIRQIRILKAQDYLINSDLSIQVISEKTGFTNPNYFYSIFKKETGLTPAAYRSTGKDTI